MLPGLLSSLVQLVETAGQQPPLLAASACWTTGRLSSWTVRERTANIVVFKPLSQGTAAARRYAGAPGARSCRSAAFAFSPRSGGDKCNETSLFLLSLLFQASCSALLVVVQETWALCRRVSEHNTIFAPFLMPCVSALVAALPRYQAKNLLVKRKSEMCVFVLTRKLPDCVRSSCRSFAWSFSRERDTSRRIGSLFFRACFFFFVLFPQTKKKKIGLANSSSCSLWYSS